MAAARILPCKPHFFKPLLPGFRQGLLIPLSFFKYLNVQNFDYAVLRTSCGKWQVKIEGRSFEDGWTDFANHHDLDVGDLLVFRYEGDMVFDVRVFGPSSCEREYQPLNASEEANSRDEQEISSESDSMQDLSRSEETLNNSLKARPTAEVSSSKLSYPYFVFTLKPYSFEGSRLYIPLAFARSHGLCKRRCEMIIIDQQRSWQVRLSHKSDGQVYIVGNGWRNFRTANGLKQGDTFSFELIEKGMKPVLVFRRFEGTSTATMVHPKTEKRSPKLAPQYFIATLTRSYLKVSGLYIPKNFAKLNGLRKYCKMTIKDPKERQWLVSLRRGKGSGRIYIAQGWNECAAANDLKEGDAIKLGLIKGGKTLAMNLSFSGGL